MSLAGQDGAFFFPGLASRVEPFLNRKLSLIGQFDREEEPDPLSPMLDSLNAQAPWQREFAGVRPSNQHHGGRPLRQLSISRKA